MGEALPETFKTKRYELRQKLVRGLYPPEMGEKGFGPVEQKTDRELLPGAKINTSMVRSEEDDLRAVVYLLRFRIRRRGRTIAGKTNGRHTEFCILARQAGGDKNRRNNCH